MKKKHCRLKEQNEALNIILLECSNKMLKKKETKKQNRLNNTII